MAETQQPFPLSRIKLARGRLVASSTSRAVLIENDRRFQPWPSNNVPWPPYDRLARAARSIHAYGAQTTVSRSRALAGRGTVTRCAGDPGPSTEAELPLLQTCCLTLSRGSPELGRSGRIAPRSRYPISAESYPLQHDLALARKRISSVARIFVQHGSRNADAMAAIFLCA